MEFDLDRSSAAQTHDVAATIHAKAAIINNFFMMPPKKNDFV